MAQQNTVGRCATTVQVKADTVKVVYHSTTVVDANEKRIILDTGGWKTATTKTRMNQAAAEYGLPYKVVQVKSKWYAMFDNGEGVSIPGRRGVYIPFDGDSLTLNL